MGVLLLLRHGQAGLGTAVYDQLSDLGRRQAAIAGERLARADLGIDRVVCGSLVRQHDTALAVLAALGRSGDVLARDERLDEYDHVGVLAAHTSEVSFEGATDAAGNRAVQPALDAAIARWMSEEDAAYAEQHAAFVARVQQALDALTAESGTTLVVTSGGVIAVACAQLLGLPRDRWPALARVMINASITKLIIGGSGTQLSSFNDHAHLEAERALITYR